MTAPPISVVVATRDRPQLLDGCLKSLRDSLRPRDELVVVDSASAAPEAIREVVLAHGGRYVRDDEAGASRARNAGWRSATHAAVAFVDDDVRVRPDWADAMSSALEGSPGYAFITGQIASADESAERPVAVFDEALPFDIDVTTRDPVGHGANHAVRRAALERVDGFDERLGPGATFRAAEDVDLWDRLLIAGERGRYDPSVEAVHVQWRSRRDYIRLDWAYGYGGGARLAKLLRTSRPRAALVANVLFWRWGLRMVYLEYRYRQPFKAMLHVIRLAGVVCGATRGLLTPLEHGRFVTWSGSRHRSR